MQSVFLGFLQRRLNVYVQGVPKVKPPLWRIISSDTKHDPIDDLVAFLSKLKWFSLKYTKTYLKDPYLYF